MRKEQNYGINKVIAKNRSAFFEYEVLKTITAGISLLPSEVKSIRSNSVSLKGTYCSVSCGEAFVLNMNIAQYKFSQKEHVTDRAKKLLLKKKEILSLEGMVKNKRITLIPLELISTTKGLLKLIIALAKGKNKMEKRQSEKNKERDILSRSYCRI
jgi:SsrA-binding protein